MTEASIVAEARPSTEPRSRKLVAVAAAGVLARLTVRPREAGELPVIYAGPLGAVIARNGTVVAAPAAGEVLR